MTKRLRYIIVFISVVVYGSESLCQSWKKYTDSAMLLRNNRQYEESLEYLGRARAELAKTDSVSNDYAENCRMAATIHFLMTDYEAAIPLYVQSNKIIYKIRGEKDSVYATTADYLGQAYYNVGDFDQSEKYFILSRRVRETLFTKDNPIYANSCNNLGNLYNRTGQYEKAEQLYVEARDIRQKILGKEDSLYAQSCNNLGDFYRRTGQYAKAESMVLEAKRIREKMQPERKHVAYAITCTNLANLYRDMGQYDRAEQFYIEAKEIRAAMTPVNKHPLYAASCNILADLYYQKGQNKKALPLYEEALQIRSKIGNGNTIDYAQTCNNLANIFLEEGETSKALELALQAKKIWDQKLPEGHPSFAVNNNLLGALYSAAGKYSEAAAYYSKAREQWKKDLGNTHPYVTQNASNLARTFWKMGDMAKADVYYTEAFNAQQGEIKKLFAFTSEDEKEQYLNNINGTNDEYYSFYFHRGRPADAAKMYDLSLQNRALILSSATSLKEFLSRSGNAKVAAIYREWTSLRKQLAYLYSNRDQSQSVQAKLLEEKASLLEKELTRTLAAQKLKSSPFPDWKQVHRSLKPGEAAIEFVNYQHFDGDRYTDSNFYAAILIRKEWVAPVMIRLFEKHQLDSLLQDAPSSVTSFYTRGIKKGTGTTGGASSYRLIWQPLEKSLKGVKKIFFAPSGKLHQVAFAALPVNDTITVGSSFQLVQLLTTASVLGLKNDVITQSDKVVLFGGVEYDQSEDNLKNYTESNNRSDGQKNTRQQAAGKFEFLPGTLEEVNALERAANNKKRSVEVLKGLKATEQAFKMREGAQSPEIFHLATHGFYFSKTGNSDSANIFRTSENPLLRAGLVLASANSAWQGMRVSQQEDGILTAYEVSDMYFPKTKLVVLSACETALGDVQGSEGVYGLQRAFKKAGVQNLIISLWEVPDRETSEFMQLFYGYLFENVSLEQAFYRTQQKMKREYPNDPYKWAAWILVR